MFDRAVVWLVNNRVLLPGVTTPAGMVAAVRQEENDRLHAALYEAVPYGLRTEVVRLLEVPEKKRVSELERLRLGPMKVSGKAMRLALDRAREVRGLGAGAVDAGRVPAARTTGLARYGLTSKAPTLKRLEVTRQTAPLLATVWHLETATVDDALDLLHALMATKLLAKAERMGNDAKLKALPQLRKAAKKVAAAVDVLLATPPATDTGELVSVVDAWSAIERVVPRKQLAEALATIAAVVPDTDGDDDAEWRAELVARYGTVRGFIPLLVEVIDLGAVEAGSPVVKTLKGLPNLIGRRKVGAEEVASDLVTGSWRRLVFANPDLPHGVVDKAAYSFCVLEHLHRSLRRRDVFARDGDRWGDPRVKLLAGAKWTAAEPKVLTALGLESQPAGHLAELASALHAAYVQVAAGLPGNSALEIVGGRLKLAELGKAEEPRLMPPFRQLVNSMLPKVDFPELLLEVAELTGMADAFTHVSGAGSGMEGFTPSLCAVLLSEACNVGMTPVIKPDVPALPRGRPVQVGQGYFRAENISAANGPFIEAQAKIDVVRAWGGGLVASADGVRFTVPVQTLSAGLNPRYNWLPTASPSPTS
ncbi:Tn3 family transposase [Streptomyces sp. Sce081]|uniref:Tn3 family transposase n=1 Tax=Streptomyces sp. Sce081 TaxID=3349853 RepID=UPI0035F248BC